MNIIDGFNGLASMSSAHDVRVARLRGVPGRRSVVLSASLIMTGAVLGFFIWNFPAGLIFLGDGGAYFIGFMLAELSSCSDAQSRRSAWYPCCSSCTRSSRRYSRSAAEELFAASARQCPTASICTRSVHNRLIRMGGRPPRERASPDRPQLADLAFLWLLCLLSVIPSVLS